MIIVPLFLVALGIGVFALLQLILQFKKNPVNLTQIILGFALSILIFGINALIYYIQGDVWSFSPTFRVILFMVFLPFVVYLFLLVLKQPSLKYVINILLVNIAFAGIFAFGLFIALSSFLEFINVNLYY